MFFPSRCTYLPIYATTFRCLGGKRDLPIRKYAIDRYFVFSIQVTVILISRSCGGLAREQFLCRLYEQISSFADDQRGQVPPGKWSSSLSIAVRSIDCESETENRNQKSSWPIVAIFFHHSITFTIRSILQLCFDRFQR